MNVKCLKYFLNSNIFLSSSRTYRKRIIKKKIIVIDYYAPTELGMNTYITFDSYLTT